MIKNIIIFIFILSLNFLPSHAGINISSPPLSQGSGLPGGSETEIQFHDSGGIFGGDPGLTYLKATDALSCGTLNLSGLTASQFVKTDGSKNLVSSVSVSLTADVSGILPLPNGGTNKALSASAGSIAFSDADSLEFSAVGTTGQALVSGGIGTPTFFAPTGGSILFAGTSGILAQDNSSFFWNDASNRLGIGINTPSTTLQVKANTPGTVGDSPAGQIIIQALGTSINANAVITGSNSDGSGNPNIGLWYFGSSSGSNANITLLNRQNARLDLGTNGSTRLTVASDGDVGIGTTLPGSKLEVAGQVKITGGSPGAGKVLTSDALGLATWETAGADTSIYNSNGTIGAGRTVGVTDTVNFDSNTFVIDGSNNRVGIGIAAPTNKLHIENGQIRIKSSGSGATTGGGLVLVRSANTGTTQLNIFTILNLDGTLKANAHYGVISDRMQVTNNGGGNTIGPALVFGGTDWIAVSDRRLKKSIKKISYGLDTLMKLRPRRFIWKHSGKKDIGFIAQEVNKIIPEIVDTVEGDDGERKLEENEGSWLLNEKKIIAVLVKAVQEQQEQINRLKVLLEKR